MPKTKVVDNKKKCNGCLKWLDISLFGTFLDKKKTKTKGQWIAGKRYINSKCKTCASKTSGKWSKENRDIVYSKWIEKKDRYLKQIHEGYGGKCACCGETNPMFLTIDHVNNDGYKERPRNKNGNHSESTYSGHKYVKIIKECFPNHLQLLCWNCNCGKARNKGICPHKI